MNQNKNGSDFRNGAQKDAELNLWIQQQVESQLFDQKSYKEWLEEQKNNEEDHDWETIDRIEDNVWLQVCNICDMERTSKNIERKNGWRW
jgi:hypothetical protein